MELLKGLKYRSAFLIYILFSKNNPIPNSQESPYRHTGTENSILPLPIDWIMGTCSVWGQSDFLIQEFRIVSQNK